MAVKGLKKVEYRGLKTSHWRVRFFPKDWDVIRVRMRGGRKKSSPEAAFKIIKKEVVLAADLADECLPDRGTPEWERLFGGCEQVLALHLGSCVENRTQWRCEAAVSQQQQGAARAASPGPAAGAAPAGKLAAEEAAGSMPAGELVAADGGVGPRGDASAHMGS